MTSFIVKTLTNPVYAVADNSSINCMVEFEDMLFALPFTASKNDVELHGQQIYKQIVSGIWGSIGAYVPPAPKESVKEVPKKEEQAEPDII